jgi:hypothetical protein
MWGAIGEPEGGAYYPDRQRIRYGYDPIKDEIHVCIYSDMQGVLRFWRIPTSALAQFERSPDTTDTPQGI